MKNISSLSGVLNALTALAVLIPSAHAGEAVPAAAAQMAAAPVPFSKAEVIKFAEKVADKQLQIIADGPSNGRIPSASFKKTDWVQGALFVGLRDLADHTSNPRYKDAIMERGQDTGWQPGTRTYHADDQVIGQAYLWAATHGAGSDATGPLRARFDQILAAPPGNASLQHGDRGDRAIADCTKRWCWADALFMAPPAWIEMSKITGDPKYADYAKAQFAASTAYLFDKSEHLFYRDSRFFDRRGPNGEKIFWSRGNGWVFAGLARMIPMLAKDDPMRATMEDLFRQMADRLLVLQKPDGYWSPSLLADPATTRPEASGTAFFTYGLAWGIKTGLLERSKFEASVRRGWTALARAVHPDGFLGYVQPIGDRPDNVSYDDTQFYGGGAFLMAAMAVADLGLSSGTELAAPATTSGPEMVLNVRIDGTKEYRLTTQYTVAPDHKIGDRQIAFQGLGWENALVAYRLYLDERMAVDLFGKKTPGKVLQTLGIGKDSYHKMSPWGMDILDVGDTVGLGGIGRLRNGKAVRLGRSTISVNIDNANPQEAAALVKNIGLDEGKSNLLTRLSVRAGSALTRVAASADGEADAPFITGLVKHHDVSVLQEGADGSGWAYVATWGRQSMAKDNLGMAIFYRPHSVTGSPVDDGATLYVTFKDPGKMSYAYGYAWEADQQNIKSLGDFKLWLDKRRWELADKQKGK